jgi:hypothetical protein
MTTVLHVSDPDEDGYTRVVFLDPVNGELRANLATPLENFNMVYDPTQNQMVRGDEITYVTNVLNGQRECLLAGEVQELYLDGDQVWSKPAPKAQKQPAAE